MSNYPFFRFMFSIKLDPDSNCIILNNSDDGLPSSIHPVFHEELDLLGFDKYWEYEKCDEPLLWRVNRTYYYKGNKVARAVGGNFFERPKIELFVEDLTLEPVDVELMVKKNADLMQKVENDALEFIYQTRKRFADYITLVGFSGGKDSLAILDLVQRALAKDEFSVVFNDTSMELPETISYVEEIRKSYPDITFYITKHDVPAIDYWKLFAPPSRIHRWCCTVYKMLPTVKFIKDNFPNDRILFFDGIRAEESPKRARMEKITKGKNFRQINAHPIIKWNSAMVWLYTFKRHLKINPLYRYGLNRIGCVVCPFESEWWETIIGNEFYSSAKPYLDVIAEFAKKRGVADIEDFIREGNWKVRVGDGIRHKSKVLVLKEQNKTKILVESSVEKFLEWFKVLKGVKAEGNTIRFIFDGYDRFIEYRADGKLTIEIMDANTKLVGILKKIAFKSAYCIACGACEVNCPDNAIRKENGFIKIENCSHCLKCVKIAEKGCLRAESLKVFYGGSGMGLDKIGNYKTFGLSLNQ